MARKKREIEPTPYTRPLPPEKRVPIPKRCARDEYEELVRQLIEFCGRGKNEEMVQKYSCGKEDIDEYSVRCRRRIIENVDASPFFFRKFPHIRDQFSVEDSHISRIFGVEERNNTKVCHLIFNPDLTLSEIFLCYEDRTITDVYETKYDVSCCEDVKEYDDMEEPTFQYTRRHVTNASLAGINHSQSIDTLRKKPSWSQLKWKINPRGDAEKLYVFTLVRAIQDPNVVSQTLRSLGNHLRFVRISEFEVMYCLEIFSF